MTYNTKTLLLYLQIISLQFRNAVICYLYSYIHNDNTYAFFKIKWRSRANGLAAYSHTGRINCLYYYYECVYIATRVYRCKPYLRLLSSCCRISYTNRDNCYLSRLYGAKRSAAYLEIPLARVMIFMYRTLNSNLFIRSRKHENQCCIHSRPIIASIKNKVIISIMR